MTSHFHLRASRLCVNSSAKRLIHTTACSKRRNYDYLPPYRKDEPIRDEPRTDFIESRDDFKYVERLIPSLSIPKVPEHKQYPTPSGWSPPAGASPDTPYKVARTRYQGFPVYLHSVAGRQHWTYVKNIQGDIWSLSEDLKQYLEEKDGRPIPLTVNEYARRIKYKGLYQDEVKKWLADKGF